MVERWHYLPNLLAHIKTAMLMALVISPALTRWITSRIWCRRYLVLPIYPSPDKDFGYDVADYLTIDPKFGNLQDFDHLIAEAHKRDLRVIMIWYSTILRPTPLVVESRKSQQPYHDWYLWRDPARMVSPPNNWLSHFGGRVGNMTAT